jgi:diguanylate cyclase (GGDEF)-like protein
LRGSFRESDVLARVGGDEFVVLAVETAENAEAVLVERLQEGVRRHSRTSGRPYQLSLSVGVACFDPQAPASLGDLLSGADSRMYEQKRRKREARQAGAGDPPRT